MTSYMYGVTSKTSTLLHQPIALLLLIVSVGKCALDAMGRCNRWLLSSARRQDGQAISHCAQMGQSIVLFETINLNGYGYIEQLL